ncbi:restriction endonuclease [candidate division WOR-3 bacterium]|nr:restriction endonuclease [candidate division WOR-3 bacterium]
MEIKQQEGVGRPVVQKFHSAVLAERRTKGIIVAFSFSKTAHEEVARIKLEEGVEIELRTVQELIADHYRRMGRK